jgi:hypothetical protein
MIIVTQSRNSYSQYSRRTKIKELRIFMSAFLDNIAVEHKENFVSAAENALMGCIVQKDGLTVLYEQARSRMTFDAEFMIDVARAVSSLQKRFDNPQASHESSNEDMGKEVAALSTDIKEMSRLLQQQLSESGEHEK